MKNIVISFDQIKYEVALNELQNNIVKLNNCLDDIEKITGERTLKTLDEIEKFICEKTKFKNILLSATLLEVSDEYEYLEANLNTINHDVIEFRDNMPFIKDNVAKQLKETYTNYLEKQFISEYEILQNACEILNKLKNPALVNFLSSDYAGKYSVNLIQLNNSARL
jgi:hypothetical protein